MTPKRTSAIVDRALEDLAQARELADALTADRPILAYGLAVLDDDGFEATVRRAKRILRERLMRAEVFGTKQARRQFERRG
jgi:hypothetical protein